MKNGKAGISTILLIMCLAPTVSSFGQKAPNWSKWSWLTGEWEGKGSGKPGQGGGTFSFSPDLEKNVLVRKSHSVYPAAAGKPEIVHDDLMIIWPDTTGIPASAKYFDNEGHVIDYTINYIGNSIVLTSRLEGSQPAFRLTYDRVDRETVIVRFEISRDGNKFIPYLEGTSKKIK